jgi:multidrug efflux pump subunit AcrB
MPRHSSDDDIIRNTRNTARFFVETRQISWVLLAATAAWGFYGYTHMPQRKDPDIPVRIAVALTPWPGAGAERVEQLVTKKVEDKIGENSRVTEIKSISRTGLSVVYLELDQRLKDTGEQLDDVKLKLDGIHDLPDGAGPVFFLKDFGDTAALMLTVAGPKVSQVEVDLRARDVQPAIERVRAGAKSSPGSRVTVLLNFPYSIDPKLIQRDADLSIPWSAAKGFARDMRVFQGRGFYGLDVETRETDVRIRQYAQEFVHERLQPGDFHPDSWEPAVIRDLRDTRARLAEVAGDKYTYRELDDLTDLIEKTVKTVPQVSKISRSGILPERIFLNYSQERLASYGISPGSLPDLLRARNITLPGGMLDVQGKNLSIDPSGEFRSEKEIGDMLITASSSGSPVYLRDLMEITRGYQSPARFLNYYQSRKAQDQWQRSRAVTLAIQMRQGEQIGVFGEAVDQALNKLKAQLPSDLVMARTSDQPLQVTENVELFMRSLYEAIALVVLVSLIGFWEWRSAVLMALAIPITLAMTFGMMDVLGIDLQQVSIATLIIALGLLVDDPVVAGDAIKRDLAVGHPPVVAAWLGPTKLANAILFATITNIVAYLPFLILSGDTGRFLYSLPVVITCSLVASRVVSMTFIPLLGYYLLRGRKERSLEEVRNSGFPAFYYRIGTVAINHRWKFLLASFLFLAAGAWAMSRLHQQFFPKDLSYLSYVDVWLPEDAPLEATNMASALSESVIQKVCDEYGREHSEQGRPKPVLESLTTFVGGGGPRFWFSVSPELQALNYAQIIIQVKDKHDTQHLVDRWQSALAGAVPGARVDVRQLETGKPVGLPVQVRIAGEDIAALRSQAERVKAILSSSPQADRIRDDWGEENFTLKMQIDPDRANLAGVTNLDAAAASATGMNGYQVATLREGDKQIPVLARLRMSERSQLSDIQNLYVYSLQGSSKVPLRQISTFDYRMQTEKLRRFDQFRTITVACFPRSGALSSEVLGPILPKLRAFGKTLPLSYEMEIAGEYKEQRSGFRELALVMAISVFLIFLALVVQFRNAVKPFIVFAAIPYGMVGAVAALWIMGSPFGFMGFLGIASLVGVIVSHIIVLFDFIEEKHAEGEPLRQALLDAGIIRLRPVLITVGATVIALFPLASHGGPLWEPLCYAQIGGLTVATFITLLLVPVLYAIFVLDLKLVRGEESFAAKA